MKNTLKWLVFAMLFTVFYSKTTAQKFADSTFIRLELFDGTKIQGLILSQTPDEFHLKTESLGEITILKTSIKYADAGKKNTSRHEDNEWYQTNTSSRNYIGPSGYGLRKNEGHFQNSWIYVSELEFGLTDRVSFGAGFFVLPIFGPSYYGLKFNRPFRNEKGSFAYGVALLGDFGGSDIFFGSSPIRLGAIFAVNTFGSRDHQWTLGMANGFRFKNGLRWVGQPLVMASTMHRVSKKWRFISEDFAFNTGDGDVGLILSAGSRLMGRNTTLDLVGAILADGNGFQTIIPWLTVGVPFLQKKKK